MSHRLHYVYVTGYVTSFFFELCYEFCYESYVPSWSLQRRGKKILKSICVTPRGAKPQRRRYSKTFSALPNIFLFLILKIVSITPF